MFILSTKGCTSLGVRGGDLIQLFKGTNGVDFGTNILASMKNLIASKTKDNVANFALHYSGACTRWDSKLFLVLHTFLLVMCPTVELADSFRVRRHDRYVLL